MRSRTAEKYPGHWTCARWSKRFAACVLVTFWSVISVAPANAQFQNSSSQQTRAYRKAARKAQKDMQKYTRQQQKAMKKSAKAQRKALKRSQQRGWASGTGQR